MGLSASLDNQRLDTMLVEVVNELGQGTVMGQYDTLGVWTVPMTNGQLGMVTVEGGMPYQNSVLLST